MNIEHERLIERHLRDPWDFEHSVRLVRRYLESRGDTTSGCPTAEAACDLLELVEALFDERLTVNGAMR